MDDNASSQYTSNYDDVQILTGQCPFSSTTLVFNNRSVQVDCPNCSVSHPVNKLDHVDQFSLHSEGHLHSLVKSLLKNDKSIRERKKITHELVIVNGLSNFHCKIISPLLTYHGMHKQTAKAVRLKDLSQAEPFQCELLADRAFRIHSDRIGILGYGRDRSGSIEYLKDTLKVINHLCNQEVIVPIHVDGDGHCLVHAISRALVGSELFWHPLRVNLRFHLKCNHSRYQSLLSDFISEDEWQEIIAEADPDFVPKNGESLGLRNIHIFGLANILKRPILLLDNLEGMQSSVDYSAIFLPVLSTVAECKGKDGRLHKPLVLAWSNPARNHFIPLVGIVGRPLAKISRQMLPSVWAIKQDLLNDYIEFDDDNCCTICGGRALPEQYIRKLVGCMDDLYYEKYDIIPGLIEEFYRQLSNDITSIWLQPREVATATANAVREGRLLRCLSCYAIIEHNPRFSAIDLKEGGPIYELIRQSYGELKSGQAYKLQFHRRANFSYDPISNCLCTMKTKQPNYCPLCLVGKLRRLDGQGNIAYSNGDVTKTPADPNFSQCCEFKHYWDGKEYDNLPEIIPINFEIYGKKVESQFTWFENDSDPSNNSNAYQIAKELILKHLPDYFNSQQLVQRLATKVLESLRNSGRKDMRDCHSLQDRQFNQRVLNKHRQHLSTPYEQILPTSSTANQETRQVTKPKNTFYNNPRVNEESKSESNKKIRVSTPGNGKSVMMTIDESTTLVDLQNKIETEFGIPVQSQRLRYGFPPTELSTRDCLNAGPLPIRGGEKLTVDSVPATTSWSTSCDENYLPRNKPELMENNAMDSQYVDNINVQENSILDSTTLAYGRLYYIQFKQKCTQLMDGLHLQLQDLPNIVLVYNKLKDRLEICTGSNHLSVYHLDIEKVTIMSDLFQKCQLFGFDNFISTNPSQCYRVLNDRYNAISKQHEQNEAIRDSSSTFSIQLDTYNSPGEDLTGACASVASAQNSEPNHDIAISSNSESTMKCEDSYKYTRKLSQSLVLIMDIIKQRIADVTSGIAKKEAELNDVMRLIKSERNTDQLATLKYRRRAIKSALATLKRELEASVEKQESIMKSNLT